MLPKEPSVEPIGDGQAGSLGAGLDQGGQAQCLSDGGVRLPGDGKSPIALKLTQRLAGAGPETPSISPRE